MGCLKLSYLYCVRSTRYQPQMRIVRGREPEPSREENIAQWWWLPDPLAEKFYAWNPYSYAGNNPIRNIDPDGRDWYAYDEEYEDEEGNKKTRTQYMYYSGTMSKKQMENMANNGYTNLEHLGETYIVGDKFYSKDGDIVTMQVGDIIERSGTFYRWDGESYSVTGHRGLESTSFVEPLFNVAQWAVSEGLQLFGVNESAADLISAGAVLIVAGGKAKGAKGMPHGDAGRALTKAEKQIAELQKQLQTATGTEKGKIEQTIRNIQRTAQKKAKGETHWRR